MKKNTLIFSLLLTSLSLTAFAYLNWNHTMVDAEKSSCNQSAVFHSNFVSLPGQQGELDLVYKVDNRFIATITRENLLQAKSIVDILPQQATHLREAYRNVRVSLIEPGPTITELGDTEKLSPAQIQLLQSTDYTSNIRITALCKNKNAVMGDLKEDSLAYHLSIIPEKEAAFVNGYEALVDYLKENSKEKTAIIKRDKLQAGKVNFTVTKEGRIANVKLTSTSGYPAVDKTLLDLISNMPGKWNPARNAKGQKVDQELVFFFGLEGC